MEANRTCQTCGGTVASDAPFGQCPKCLIELGLGRPSEPLQDPRPLIGAKLKFGEYELLKQIGRGGMGVVYKARQANLNRTVALKMVLDAHLASPTVLRRFLIEAEAAAKLEHPNIVPIYDIAEVDGHHFFTMRFIEGHSLEQKIAVGDFNVATNGNGLKVGRDKVQERIASFVATIARAMHYAHERGVLHRDLKPSNILIDNEGRPHLTDFGLAKLAGSDVNLTPKTAVIGTPGYMPPEQASGRESGVGADIYGLGAILYKLLTGKPPFEGSTPLEVLRRTEVDEAINPRKINAAIDAELSVICLKCLEKNPAERYGSAKALADDLERWLRHEPIQARPVRLPGRLWRWCQREPILAGMTMGLIVLMTAITALTATLYQREKKDRLALEQRSARERQALIDRMERDRLRGDKHLRVSAPEMAILLGRQLLIDGLETPITISAVTSERNPDRAIVPVAHMLFDIQDKFRAQHNLRILFDLLLYQKVEDTGEALTAGTDVAWTDAAIYVKARQNIDGLVPLVRETYASGPEVQAMIVTRLDSGIATLADLKGRSFAFFNRGSAMGWYLARAKLAEAGLRQRDLHCTNFSAGRVLTAVRTGVFDAGVVARGELEKLRQAGADLRVLAEIRCPGHPWLLTSKRLNPKMVNALHGAFLSLRDTTVLGRIDEVIGFVAASPADYDQLEKEIERAKEFDDELK